MMAGVTPRAPNIVLVMSDQHRGDMMGCAGDAGVLTPNLDRLARRGRALLASVVPGPAVHAGARVVHDRALRARPRRVHELGRDRGGLADLRLGAPRGRLPHDVARQGAPVPRRDPHAAHVDDLAPPPHGARLRRGARDRRQVQQLDAEPLHRPPPRTRAARRVPAAHRRPQLPRRQRDAGRTRRSACRCGTRRRCRCRSTRTSTRWHGAEAVRWIEQYDRARAVLPVRRLPRTARSVGRAREAVDRYADVDVSMPTHDEAARDRRHRSVRRAARRVPVAVGHRDDDRRRDPRDAARVQRRHLRHRRRRRPHRRRARAHAELLDDTWVIYTSDHGEMGGNHGLMSKCVLYEPAVRVPLIVRPPGGCAPRVVDALVEHIDVPASVRDDRGRARRCPTSEGRSLLGYLDGDDPAPRDSLGQRELGIRVRSRPSATSSSSTRTRARRASCSISSTTRTRTRTCSPIPNARRSSTS